MKKILLLSLILLLIVQISALYTEEDSKMDFGHVVRITDLNVPELAPGESGILKVVLKNNANYHISDIRGTLNLPSQIQFLNDVSKVKIARIESGESEEMNFRILALPSSDEGIYEGVLEVDYVSHFGKGYINVGTDKQDNYTFGMIIKDTPNIFMQIEDTEVYKGEDSGEITLRFINNYPANVKFLTVELKESEDYEIISDSREYIGDLDSDDFESVKFRVKLKKEEAITLLVKLTYKDSMNNDYSDDLELGFEIRGAADLGKSAGNGTFSTVLFIIILAIIIYYFYRRYRKKKLRARKFE